MATRPTASLEHEPGGRRVVITSPNPRRTLPHPPLTDTKLLQDGRKRQKLSHNSREESQNTEAIGDEVARVCKSQESGSSDQSASKWFQDASKNMNNVHKEQAELGGTLRMNLSGSR